MHFTRTAVASLSAKYGLPSSLKAVLAQLENRHISKATVGVLAAKIGGLAVAFVVQVPLTRMLGAEDYGTYVFVLSWVTVAGILARFGMDMTFVRHVPAFVAETKWLQLKGIIVFGSAGALAVTALVALVAYASFYAIGGQETAYLHYVPVGVVLLLVLTASQLMRGLLRGLHVVLWPEVTDSVLRPLLLLVFFMLLGSVLSVQATFAVLWANVLAVAAVAVVLAGHLGRHLPRAAVTAVPDMAERRDWLMTALPMIFIAGMTLIMSRTDIIMLGSLAGPAEAGIYAIGSRVAELATLGLVAVNTVLAPRISEMYRDDDRRPLQALLRLAAWFSFAFTACAALVLVGLGRFVLPIFGEDFAAAYVPMLILLAGQVINALAGSVGFLMTMTGRQKEAAAVMFVAVLINVGGNWLLIPPYGMTGAAIATGLSIVFWNVVLCVRVVGSVRLNPSILPMRLS